MSPHTQFPAWRCSGSGLWMCMDIAHHPEDQKGRGNAFVDLAFAEARKRTSSLVELPEGETIDIQYLPEWEHEAAAYCRGNYRTHIVINTAAAATSLSRLFDHKVCHEGYPGHHTDYVLKEEHLARHGYLEQTLYLTLVPPMRGQ